STDDVIDAGMRRSVVGSLGARYERLYLASDESTRNPLCSSNRTNGSGKRRYGARNDSIEANSRSTRVECSISQRAVRSSIRSNAVWVTPWQPSSWFASTSARTADG